MLTEGCGAFLGTLCPWARLSENRPEPSKEQDARDSSAWAEPEGLWPLELPLPRETLGRISISDRPKFLKAGPGCPVPPSLTQGGGRTGRIPYCTLIKDLEVREVESHLIQYLTSPGQVLFLQRAFQVELLALWALTDFRQILVSGCVLASLSPRVWEVPVLTLVLSALC